MGREGEELWNSIEGQKGNLFAGSSILLYFDIWCPLPGQIGAIQRVCRGRERKRVSLFSDYTSDKFEDMNGGSALRSIAIDWPHLFHRRALRQMQSAIPPKMATLQNSPPTRRRRKETITLMSLYLIFSLLQHEAQTQSGRIHSMVVCKTISFPSPIRRVSCFQRTAFLYWGPECNMVSSHLQAEIYLLPRIGHQNTVLLNSFAQCLSFSHILMCYCVLFGINSLSRENNRFKAHSA